MSKKAIITGGFEDMNKKAIITGVTGQDGSYLAELLLSKGYKVYGLKRRLSTIMTDRIDPLMENDNFQLMYYNLLDPSRVMQLVKEIEPDEVYNLAAQSHVRVSFDVPVATVRGITEGTMYWLDAIRILKPDTRFYQASSSEMFGDNPNAPFNEESRFMPASPYACAKVFAHNLVRNYRVGHKLYACSGILFNHESPRRGETFVTRKITMAASKIKIGLQKELRLGNLDAKRDWGHARDYVELMWMMLQQETPDDYVIATGESYSVKEFLEATFEAAGLDPYKYLKLDERLLRPQEVPFLLGDASRARDKLGWVPKTSFKELVKEMYESDLDLITKQLRIDLNLGIDKIKE